MQLVIYRLCDEDQLNPHLETAVRTQWSDCEPTQGDLVGFGSDRSFDVAQVYSYKPTGDSPVETVYVAFCQLPNSNIPPEEWRCWQWLEHVESMQIVVRLEAVGLPDLGCEFDATGEPPQLPQRIQGGVLAGDGSSTRMISMPTKWVIDRYHAYKPEGETPYIAVYLAFCKVVPMAEPAPAEPAKLAA